jgi:carbonic anhydrase
MNRDILFSIPTKDANTYSRGVIPAHTGWSNLTVTGAVDGYLEWRINFPSAGKYRLHAQLTAIDSRPCLLKINGADQGTPILGETTGGWHGDKLQWFVYGPYEFKAGENLLRIEFKQYLPHLQAFGFSQANEPHEAGLDARGALKQLKDGYQRYLTGKSRVNPQQVHAQVKANAKDQKPFAIVLACADSRVPPEIIFDQDIGDLFVLRVAGNIADTFVLGSIQYAIEHLGTRLVVVLGHERCGAINAAISVAAKKASFSGPLGQLVSAIVPLVEPVYRCGILAGHPQVDAAVLEDAVRVNVRRQTAVIRDALENLGQEKLTLELWLRHILVVGARYDLDDGAVEFFDEPVNDRPKRIGLIAKGGYSVAVAPSGILTACKDQSFDEFELHDAGEGQIALKSLAGEFLGTSADGVGVALAGPQIEDLQRFRLVELGDERFAFENIKGRYLSVAPDGRLTTAAVAYECEYFHIIKVDD